MANEQQKSAILIWNAQDCQLVNGGLEQVQILTQLVEQRHTLKQFTIIAEDVIKTKIPSSVNFLISAEPRVEMCVSLMRQLSLDDIDYVYLVASAQGAISSLTLALIAQFQVNVVLIHPEPSVEDHVVDSVTEHVVWLDLFKEEVKEALKNSPVEEDRRQLRKQVVTSRDSLDVANLPQELGHSKGVSQKANESSLKKARKASKGRPTPDADQLQPALIAMYECTTKTQIGFHNVSAIHELMHNKIWFRDLGYSKLKFVWDDLQALGLLVKSFIDDHNYEIGLSMKGYIRAIQVGEHKRDEEDGFAAVKVLAEKLKDENQTVDMATLYSQLLPYCGPKTKNYILKSNVLKL